MMMQIFEIIWGMWHHEQLPFYKQQKHLYQQQQK